MENQKHIEQRIENHIKKIEDDFNSEQTFGERIADIVAKFGGSWTFIFCMLGTLSIWILFNTLTLFQIIRFDPFPFILLNLALSLVASLQAPVIMLSNNRQSVRDRHYRDLDFRHNFVAAEEISEIHSHTDEIVESTRETKEMYEKLKVVYDELKEVYPMIKDIHQYVTENGWSNK